MLVPEHGDLRQFLECDDVVDWRHPVILETSQELTDGLTGDVSTAEALFKWVRDTVPHTLDVGREEVTCSASQVLKRGTGLCYAKAHLLAAMLRSVAIPAGFCYQVYYEPLQKSPQRLALHGLNGIYLESVGKWVRVDARGNKPGVDYGYTALTRVSSGRMIGHSAGMKPISAPQMRKDVRPPEGRDANERVRRPAARSQRWQGQTGGHGGSAQTLGGAGLHQRSDPSE